MGWQFSAASLFLICSLSSALSFSLVIPGQPIQNLSHDSGSVDKPMASPPGLGRKYSFPVLLAVLSGSLFATTSNRPIILLPVSIDCMVSRNGTRERKMRVDLAAKPLVFSVKIS